MTVIDMHEAGEKVSTDQKIAAAARALVAARGMKNADLAPVIGTGAGAVFAKLNGTSTWKASELVSLASYFGVSMDDIVNGLGIFGQRKAPTELMGAGARARRDSNPQPSDP